MEVGGLFWTVKQIWTGRLFSEEGVRFPGRVWVGQVVQIVVAIIGILYGIKLVDMIGDFIDEWRAEFSIHYKPLEIHEISIEDWATVTQDDLRVTDDEQDWLDTIPERW